MISLEDEASDIIVKDISSAIPLTKFEFEDPEHKTRRIREWARQWIGIIIVVCLFTIVFLSFFMIWTSPSNRDKSFTMDDYVKLVQALIGPVAGIVGAVTGFYFGAAERDREQDHIER